MDIADSNIDYLSYEDLEDLANQFEYINLIIETLKEDGQTTHAWDKLLEVSRSKLIKYMKRKNIAKIKDITNILRETIDKSF